jgi:purine nucleosidase
MKKLPSCIARGFQHLAFRFSPRLMIQAALICGFALSPLSAQSPRIVMLDSDTANEVDDLFAIVRAFEEPTFTIKALSSVQWTHRLSPPQTVLESQRLNEDLIRLLDRQDVPVPLGAEMIMGKPWGGEEPAHSPAAQMIIRLAKDLPAEQKLTLIGIGGATNIASAIKLAPEIIPKLSCYILSARYDTARGIWNKDEFNTRIDLNAANFLFNCEGLELHVMPINVLFDFKTDLDETAKHLAGRGPLWDYLVARWFAHSPGMKNRILWDLALIQAIAHPALAEEKEVLTPPENTQRKIKVYTRVDIPGLHQDWRATVEKSTRQKK